MKGKLYINGKFLCSPVTGVQRYALEVLGQIDGLLSEPAYQHLQVICLVPPGSLSQPAWQRISIRQVGASPANLWEQLELPFYARDGWLFSPANTGPVFFRKQVVTFHDANVFAMPSAYSRLFRLKYYFIFNLLARVAKGILTDSEFSRAELAAYLGVDRQRFSVILLGGDHLLRLEGDAGVLEKHQLTSGEYLLCVASRSQHKNFELVMRVVDILGSQVTFAAAGGRQANIFAGSGPEPLADRLRFLGYVSDAELKALYENALGFVFPSLYEGFGLPLLEAMWCGCPVISSNAASLPEVGGQAVCYFDPHDEVSLSARLVQFLADADLRDSLKQRGFEQASGFLWETCARKTLNHILDCMDKG